jgi:autotransporter-associated beta strand protein
MNENLTAYALNELPPDQRSAFEAQMKSDPALRKQAEEMREFCTLLEREAAQDSGTLMPGQRAQLVQRFQSVRSNIRPLWKRPAFLSTVGFAAAACLAVMLTIQHLKNPEGMTAVHAPAAPAAGLPEGRVAVLKDAGEPSASSVTVKAAVAEKKEFSKAQRPAPSPATPPSQAVNDLIAANNSPMPVLQIQREPAATADQKNSTPAALGVATGIQIPNSAMDPGGSLPGGASSLIKSDAGTLILGNANTYTGAMVINGGALQIQQGIQDFRPAIALESSRSSAMIPSDKDKIEVPAAGATEKKAPGAEAVSTPAASAMAAAASNPSKSPRRQLDELAKIPAQRRPMTEDEGRPGKAKQSDTDTYRPVAESPLTFVAQQPLSIVPLNADTASYANVRRFLNSGQRPPPDAVRLEELVNHFPYRYEGPSEGRPVAIHVDLADAPWQPLHRIARVAVKAREAKGGRSASAPVTVAKNVKLQIEFNSAQVAAYRLIGYDMPAPAREDDDRDKKDAGEIGAGHTVTALYEIVPAGVKYPDDKPPGENPKYARVPESRAAAAPAAPAGPAAKPAAAPSTKETMTVKLRYKEPNEDQSKLVEVTVTDAHKKLSESDRDFQFAVSVAGFGMLLRGSPNAAEFTWDGVRRLALAGKGDDEQGRRGEFIQLIEKARSLAEDRR